MTALAEKEAGIQTPMQAGGLKKNTYFIVISQAVHLTLAFFLNIVAARTLGDEDFGKYNFAIVMSYFVFLFNDLGIVTYLTREVAQQKDRIEAYFLNSAVLKILLILASGIFLWMYLGVFSFPRDKVIVVLLFGVYGLFFSFNQLGFAAYRAMERMEYEMIVLIFEKTVITSVSIYLLLQGYGILVFSVVFMCGGLLSMLLNLVLVKSKFLRKAATVDGALMKTILKASFLLGIFWFLANIHERVDVMMLTVMKGDAVVGWYSAAYKIILVCAVIPNIVMTVTLPRISSASRKDEGEVSKIYRLGLKYLFYLAVPMVVGTLFLADDMVVFLFGEQYMPGADALRVLIFAVGFDFFNVFFAVFLIAWNRKRSLALLQTGALLLNIVLNGVLIPSYAHVGAATASVVSKVLLFGVAFVLVYRRLGRPEFGPLLKGIAAALVMVLFLSYVHVHVFVSIGLAVMIYLLVLFIIGGIRPDEILVFKRSSSNA